MAWHVHFRLFLQQTLILAFALTMSQRAVAAESSVQFERGKIKLGKHVLEVEIAKTEKQHQQGLMYRKQLAENRGMLFVFEGEKPRSFWMKNTFIPLAIGFFDRERKLLEWGEMRPVKSVAEVAIDRYESKNSAMYVLELNTGWFERHKMKVGEKFEFLTQ